MLASVLLPAFTTQAAKYYVATNGSDSNVGTEAAPFRSVTKCAGLLVAGDICYVKNGTYSEVVVHIKASGTANAPIKLMAYPGHAPVIYFDDNDPSAPKHWRFLLQVTPGHNKPIAYIHIEGLTIEGGAGTKWYNCQSCVIRRNWFKNPYGSGLYGFGGIDNVIDRNVISDAGDPVIGGHGMYLTGSRYIVTNNLIYAPNSYGVQLRGNFDPTDATKWPNPEFGKTENVIISNNVFAYSHDGSGVVIFGTLNTNARIENNIFYENGQNGSNSANGVRWVSCCSTGVQIRNNLSYATSPRSTFFISSNAKEGVHYTQSGNIVNTHTPGFVNAPATPPARPDFKLTERSSAIDKGLSPAQSPGSPLATTRVDFNGTLRPQGRAYDIGAYEYSADNDAQSPAAPKALQVN
jgi:hypothetical protein